MTYIEPILPLVLLLAAVGLVRAFLVRNHRPWLLLAAFLILALASWEPFSWLLAQPLEAPYEHYHPRAEQAIVVLSGAVDLPHGFHAYTILGKDTYRRCLRAVWLYRSGLKLPILATGARVAQPMADFLASQGIPREQIWIENGSHNTHENAVYSASMLQARGIRRIVLIAEAKSILRAKRCFEKCGIAVTPSPSVITSVGTLLPNSSAIEENADTLHELGGLLYYWVRGWI